MFDIVPQSRELYLTVFRGTGKAIQISVDRTPALLDFLIWLYCINMVSAPIANNRLLF